MKKINQLYLALIFCSIGLAIFGHRIEISKGPFVRGPASEATKRIFIGIDGLSREAFDHARQELGFFKMFRSVSSHVAPFPSISDYSWNILTHSQKLHGKKGSIRSYEATYFNRDENKLYTDPRNYFRRLAQKQLYFNGAFEHYMNPYVESLLYLPTEELPKLELKKIKEGILSDPKELVTAMVASADALMHTRDSGPDFLKDLDQFLIDIEQHYKQLGIKTEIIIVSDHGQASRFQPGRKPIPLIGVDLKPIIKRTGLKLNSKLREKNDVVIPIMALGNYGTAFFKDQNYRVRFISELQKENWFSLAMFKEVVRSNQIRVSIFDQDGRAELIITRLRPGGYNYNYRPLTSNPLKLPNHSHNKSLTEQEARATCITSIYPDSLHRIAYSAFQEESDFPDLLFTIKDENYIQGDLSSFTKMYQTHGSLSRRSTMGVVASTSKTTLHGSPFLRSTEVLPRVGIEPKELFRIKEEGWFSNPAKTISLSERPGYEGIETRSEDFSNRRIFELMNKAIHYSQYVFDNPSMNTIIDIVKPFAQGASGGAPDEKLDVREIDVTSLVSLNDLANITDILIKTGDVEEVKKNPSFIKLRDKIDHYSKEKEKRSGALTSELHEHGHSDALEKARPYADLAKKTLMKAYSTTFLLEKAMDLPEFPYISDDRDFSFRRTLDSQKAELGLAPLNPKAHELAQKLFSEIFMERQILSEISPASMPLLYNPDLQKLENITFVYIPGIYNAIFDNEIFKMGLDSLVNNLGLRVISPPVFSACSSDYNAILIINYLKKDQIEQLKRGYTSPKYFILGYSKGGMDALNAFVKDPDFVRDNVHGLLAIASPLKGTSILNRSDLPFEIVNLLGTEDTPKICINQEKAAKSITPEGAESFLRKESSKLIGLTRYYSVSFVEDIKNSHLFMKVTKNLARFGEPNDGVVPLSSSRFPEEFQALDLGVIQGDHLSGIVASKFPQEAFMEALILTLAEIDATNEDKNKKFNQYAQYNAKKIPYETHRSYLANSIDRNLQRVFNDKDLSKTELKRIEGIIKAKLSGSAYDIKNFSLVKSKKGEIEIVYSSPTYNNSRYLWFLKSDEVVTVSNANEVLDIMLNKLQKSGRSIYPEQANLVELIPLAPLEKFKMPPNELGYIEDFRINLRKLSDLISGKKVTPITRDSHRNGIEINYNHHSVVDFRREYQFNFESSSPIDADDNGTSGWISSQEGDKIVATLSSKNSSIRLSTFALRFLVKDFPELTIDIQVNNDVPKADVLFGGSGKDDSAFQLWFTFRVIRPGSNRSLVESSDTMRTIGYYFGDEVPGRDLRINEIYENYYSKKNFIIATLPESKQKLIGMGKEMMNIPLISKSNLLDDIKKAFPDINADQVEILGITIQHDSNDTKGDSEAIFRSVKFN